MSAGRMIGASEIGRLQRCRDSAEKCSRQVAGQKNDEGRWLYKDMTGDFSI